MKNSNPVTMAVLLVVLACAGSISGCIVKLPKSFATAKEAFPSTQSFIPPPDAPRDSFKKAVFQVPYEDVYRAAFVSVSQEMLNIEESDKDKGEILAMRVDRSRFTVQTHPREVRYFYAVLVKEIGPEKTEISILAKRQWSCESAHACLLPLSMGVSAMGMEKCNKDIASVKLATDTVEQLAQFMALVRNNLIAAGVM